MIDDAYQQLVDMKDRLDSDLYDLYVYNTRIILEENDKPRDHDLIIRQLAVMVEYQNILALRIGYR